ncbi:MAG: acyl-CoA dehydrogenase family protein [Alphaproteobacteria bacterium]|nr:acyl-CoA dehydrogenase family protein [Alphaproteobacteria bacterium]
MTASNDPSPYRTHDVENQPPVLEDYNVFETDTAMQEALAREGGGWAEARATALGERVGSAEVLAWARQANRYVPELQTHDRFGNRIDRVDYHPAWHCLMALGIEYGVHALPWQEPRPGAHVAKAALAYLMNQGENGVCCPLAMTFAAVPALRAAPPAAAIWEPRILSSEYDPRFRPAEQKAGAVFGMAMTEKQGGSDVRANTTQARKAPGDGEGAYLLTGHKWFCSAPMSDAFLTLARTEDGLTCFLVPRWRPDGSQNRILLQRLKDKLGNRSNASAEIEFQDTWAVRIGDEGAGVRTIIAMVHHTRLDASLSAAAIVRQAVVQALHHTAHREAFGARLSEQPAMQNVLADLALESEAAITMAMRLAHGFDQAVADPSADGFVRLATAVTKFWICKRAPTVVAEAMECLGGNGYVEESLMPRLYREAPVNGIWEGTGNVICLDVMRTIERMPDSLAAFLDAVRVAKGADKRLDAHVKDLQAALVAVSANADDGRARLIVEMMALAWQASLLVQHAPPALADAFCASRLGGSGGRTVGILPAGADAASIVERAWPA